MAGKSGGRLLDPTVGAVFAEGSERFLHGLGGAARRHLGGHRDHSQAARAELLVLQTKVRELGALLALRSRLQRAVT